jgi:hypothetical protein
MIAGHFTRRWEEEEYVALWEYSKIKSNSCQTNIDRLGSSPPKSTAFKAVENSLIDFRKFIEQMEMLRADEKYACVNWRWAGSIGGHITFEQSRKPARRSRLEGCLVTFLCSEYSSGENLHFQRQQAQV